MEELLGLRLGGAVGINGVEPCVFVCGFAAGARNRDGTFFIVTNNSLSTLHLAGQVFFLNVLRNTALLSARIKFV